MKKFIFAIVVAILGVINVNAVNINGVSNPHASNVKIENVHNHSKKTTAQCQAITKKGTRCKRNAANGSKYCWQHGG